MYMYRAAIWCFECLATELDITDPHQLDNTLIARGIDPQEEWQWDSDDFPKQVPPFYSGLRVDCHEH